MPLLLVSVLLGRRHGRSDAEARVLFRRCDPQLTVSAVGVVGERASKGRRHQLGPQVHGALAAGPGAAAAPAAGAPRAVAFWLLACCAMVFAIVVVGGVTRLTHSGLSITEWQPPPGSASAS